MTLTQSARRARLARAFDRALWGGRAIPGVEIRVEGGRAQKLGRFRVQVVDSRLSRPYILSYGKFLSDALNRARQAWANKRVGLPEGSR